MCFPSTRKFWQLRFTHHKRRCSLSFLRLMEGERGLSIRAICGAILGASKLHWNIVLINRTSAKRRKSGVNIDEMMIMRRKRRKSFVHPFQALVWRCWRVAEVVQQTINVILSVKEQSLTSQQIYSKLTTFANVRTVLDGMKEFAMLK